MKKIIYGFMLAAGALSAACSENPGLYEPGDDRVMFLLKGDDGHTYLKNNTDTILSYSFVYNSLETDEVPVGVKTIGMLSDRDRTVSIRQVPTGLADAVPGVHYVALTDPWYNGKLVIPAGKTSAQLPIKVLRDASLKDGAVNLRLQIVENEYFRPGIAIRTELLVTLSDQLSKPENWHAQTVRHFGAYGPVKHQFMIDASGEKIDENYFLELGFMMGGGFAPTFDESYVGYTVARFREKLAAENLRRQGLTPPLEALKEADGNLVSF